MSRFFSPAGSTNDMMAMLTVIGNADEFRKKVESLQAVEQSIEEKIAIAGKAEDITRLHREAQEAKDESLLSLENARVSAKLIIDTAKLEAQRLTEAAALQSAKIREEADAYKAAARREGETIIANANEVEENANSRAILLQIENEELQKSKKAHLADFGVLLDKERDIVRREAEIAKEWEEIEFAKVLIEDERRNIKTHAKELTEYAISQKKGYDAFIARLNG